jgi:hypothetical protein
VAGIGMVADIMRKKRATYHLAIHRGRWKADDMINHFVGFCSAKK